MCLAIPLHITAIDGEWATVTRGGVARRVSLVLTPEARMGDHVLVHAGFAIAVLDEEEARATLALFAELENAHPRRAGDADTPAPSNDPPGADRPQ